MKKVKHMHHFVDGVLYKVIMHVYIFFVINVLFALSNIFLLFVIFSAQLTNTWFFLFLGLLPLGPALGAAFYSMGKLVREGDINPVKSYIKGYTMNFKIAFIFGLIQSILLASLVVNLVIVFDNFLLAVLLMLPIIMLSMVTLYGFAVLSRFEMKIKNLFTLSIYLTFKKWPITLYNFIVTAFIILMFNLLTAYILPFVASVYVFWIMKNLKPILKELMEERAT